MATELEEFKGSVTATTTGAAGIEHGVMTKSVDIVEEVSPVAAVLSRASWCRAAHIGAQELSLPMPANFWSP